MATQVCTQDHIRVDKRQRCASLCVFILVRNNVDVDVPEVIASDKQLLRLTKERRFDIVRTALNALNNR